MTLLTVGTLEAASGTNIKVSDGSALCSPGGVCQTVYVRSDERVVYTAVPSGYGIPINELSIGIAPKSARDDIILTWMINAEAGENVVFFLFQDGQYLDIGKPQDRWNGIVTMNYDQNNDSTMYNMCLMYMLPAFSTDYRVYTPAIRSSYSASNYTVTLNRTIASTGQNDYETTISTGVAMDIFI